MMDISLSEKIQLHKSEAEWLFAYCAMIQADRARQECGWMKPETLQDPDLRRFWTLVLEGEDGTQASIHTGITYKLMGYDSRVSNTYSGLEAYAAAITDDQYLIAVSESLGKIAGMIGKYKIPEIKDEIASLGLMAPLGGLTIPTASDVAVEFLGHLDDKPDTIMTGIPLFDTKFGGFYRQTLSVLAARPSMGKTALALQIAKETAIAGKKVIYFSLEMAQRFLWARMALGEAKVSAIKLKTHTLSEHDRQALIDATNTLVGKLNDRLFIDDRSGITSADIWQAVSRIRPDLIVVDHLAKVLDTGDNESHRLGHITSAGKRIAKEFNLASLYICQLNRDVERRTEKRPGMSDLRDSGEIEQDADAVIFIHRPDYYTVSGMEVGVSPTELCIAKDRDGVRGGYVKAQYNLSQQRFYGEAKE